MAINVIHTKIWQQILLHFLGLLFLTLHIDRVPFLVSLLYLIIFCSCLMTLSHDYLRKYEQRVRTCIICTSTSCHGTRYCLLPETATPGCQPLHDLQVSGSPRNMTHINTGCNNLLTQEAEYNQPQ